MFDETSGTQEALDPQDSVDQGIEVTDQTTTEEAAGGLFPDSPAPERPIPQPQAHRGVITGVTAETAPNTGTQFLKFSYQSKENANSDNLAVWLPKAYAIDPTVDPATLSDEQPIKEDGTKGMSERAKYARAVRNSKGTGTIETIAKIANDQGHTVSLPIPRTFSQLANYLNQLCTGTEIVALLKAEGGDGEFADRLRTQGFVSQEYADNPKFLKNFRKLWQEGQ